MERAAARRHQVHRIVAVVLVPDRFVLRNIDQIPGGKGHVVERADEIALGVAGRRRGGYADHRRGVALLAAGQAVEQFGQGLLALAEDDGIGPGGEVLLLVVGGIGAGDDDVAATGLGRRDHAEGRLAHARQAHLAQVVEAILVDDGEAGAVGIKGRRPLVLALGEHAVEQRHIVPLRAQVRCGVEGAEGRVRHHGRPLFGIEA